MNSPVQLTLPLQLLCQLRGSVTGTDSSVKIEPVTLPEGYVPHPDIGVAYKLHNRTVSWRMARKQCNDEGADLGLIDSDTKLEYTLRQNPNADFTHVGILRMYDDEEWVAVRTGLPVSPIPWAENEPRGSTDCVMIKNSDKGLANYACSKKGNYLCEMPIPMNHIVQVIQPTNESAPRIPAS